MPAMSKERQMSLRDLPLSTKYSHDDRSSSVDKTYTFYKYDITFVSTDIVDTKKLFHVVKPSC